ncbi:ribonuclease P protein component [Trueperella sp. LYQ143]|uniref:ribonuclease P protein component n=1 Tax=Trueperella sp. LYQ143 TaxID=3391059 RepID=UPI0039839148
MLPRANRMRRSEVFTTTMRHGRRCGDTLLVMYINDEPEADLEVGFTVSKKVGNSVVRHRVARQLRHIMRGYLPILVEESISGVVIRALPPAAKASSSELQNSIEKCLMRWGICG